MNTNERSKAQRVASVIFDAILDTIATRADVQARGGEPRVLVTLRYLPPGHG